MCGIFGHIGHIDRQLAEYCTNTLAHRGPDGVGIEWNERFCLGHRRLAILDLSEAGKQPMSYAEGRYTIVFNGEIYNFLEVKQELGAKGYRFRTESDTEVIMAAYDAWGAECLQKFNGMWALAIWDERDRSLFLARDRFGKKPLYYTNVNSGFAFASEMKALTPLLASIEPDRDLLRLKLTEYEQGHRCLIKGIERFPSGHYGYLRDGTLALTKYWETLDHLVTVPDRYEEQVAMFRELFADACRIRMRSDVPLGTALSGGVDSSAVAAMVAQKGKQGGERLAGNWQNAFIASFPGAVIDERRYAEAVARHLGITPTVVAVDPLKYVDRLDDIFYRFEDVYHTSPIPFVALYGAMREHCVIVTLDGHAGDELFGGYGFDLTRFAGSLRNPADLFRVMRAIHGQQITDGNQFTHSSFPVAYTKQLLRSLLKPKVEIEDELTAHPNWNKLDGLNRILYRSTHRNVLPTLLRNYDRYSMINGVEIRMPFLDHRIVSFAFSLPWTAKIRNGFGKAIVRDAVAPYLPASIAYRKDKIGFNTPIVEWMRGPLKPYFLDTINSQTFADSSIIDHGKTKQAVMSVIDGTSPTFAQGVDAWKLLSPFLWEQSFLKIVKQNRRNNARA